PRPGSASGHPCPPRVSRRYSLAVMARWGPGIRTRGWPLRRRVLAWLAAAMAVVVAGVVTILVVTAKGPDHDYRTGTITILTGGTQGIYYDYGEQLAEAIDQRLAH